MEFIITTDTGNIRKDILNTVIQFSDEQMNQLLEEIKFEKSYDNSLRGKLAYFRYPDYDVDLFLKRKKNNIPRKEPSHQTGCYGVSLKALLKIIKEEKNQKMINI